MTSSTTHAAHAPTRLRTALLGRFAAAPTLHAGGPDTPSDSRSADTMSYRLEGVGDFLGEPVRHRIPGEWPSSDQALAAAASRHDRLVALQATDWTPGTPGRYGIDDGVEVVLPSGERCRCLRDDAGRPSALGSIEALPPTAAHAATR